jgi:hypothetical protein
MSCGSEKQAKSKLIHDGIGAAAKNVLKVGVVRHIKDSACIRDASILTAGFPGAHTAIA